MDEFYNKHYVTVDEQNRIINGFSDSFRQPSETDICINEQGGYHFRLKFADGSISEENPMLFEFEHMIPLYAYENGAVKARTQEKIDADIAVIPEPEAIITVDEKIEMLQAALAESDAVAMALYEETVNQSAVNAEQDAAILGLYEMIGG